jgi:hypothetical protein
MSYSPWSSLAIALGLAACGPDPSTGPGGAEPASGPSAAVTAAAGTWRTRKPYPTYLFDAKSAAITDPATLRTTLYVVGGRSGPRLYNNVYRVVRTYDVATMKWGTRAPFPVRILGPNGAVEVNGKIYVSGGVTSYYDSLRGWRGKALNTLYMYAPATDKWTRLKDMPYATAYGVSGTYGGKLYAAVYCDAVAACVNGVLLRYNPSTNNWMSLGPTPHSPAFAGGGFISGKLYLVDMDGHVDAYDVASATWSPGPVAPFQALGIAFCPPASAIMLAKVYLAGCLPVDNTSGLYPMLVFDPKLGTWAQTAPTPIAVSGHWWSLARVLVNGKPGLELVGGIYPDNHAQFMP